MEYINEIQYNNKTFTLKELSEAYSIFNKIIVDITEIIDIFGDNINRFISKVNSDSDYYRGCRDDVSPSESLFNSLSKYYSVAKGLEHFGFEFSKFLNEQDRCVFDGKDGLIKFIDNVEKSRCIIGGLIKKIIDDNELETHLVENNNGK